MSKKIYLIRHGQSEANAEGRVQGWLDSPLSRLGHRQAHSLARRLKTVEPAFFALFSSTLQRAAQTAHILAVSLQCPLHFEDDLREYNMGPITGLTYTEIKEQFPNRHRAFERNEPLPHLPGAETESAFGGRVQNCTAQIVARIPQGDAAVVVAHGGTLNAILRGWLGLDNHRRRPFSFGNASISVVTINPTHVRLLHLNDVCHLENMVTSEDLG